MLMTLLDGRAFAAGELARVANISAQSASMHLAQLLEGGFVQVAQEGRHRYYRITSSEVAHAIESLGVIASPRKRKPIGEDDAVSYARICYDHLAGKLAVQMAETFVGRGLLVIRTEREYDLSTSGEQFVRQWQIEPDSLRNKRRYFARRCLDWTERRHHLAGALGAALYEKFQDLGWLERAGETRVVRVTPDGKRALQRMLSL
jgi:predicted transcriptional regulator